MMRVSTPAGQRGQMWEALIDASYEEVDILSTRTKVKLFRWLRSVDCAVLLSSV